MIEISAVLCLYTDPHEAFPELARAHVKDMVDLTDKYGDGIR
jgi:hypothetical protein